MDDEALELQMSCNAFQEALKQCFKNHFGVEFNPKIVVYTFSHLLGILCSQEGDPEKAIKSILGLIENNFRMLMQEKEKGSQSADQAQSA